MVSNTSRNGGAVMIGLNRRRTMGKIGLPTDIIMTTETNPGVLAICYAKGWCASDQYMTAREAAAVTNIGYAFSNKSTVTHFEEFEYFTGVTSLQDYAFYNDKFTSIVIPASITTIGQRVFQYCSSCRSFKFLADTPPTIGDYLFNNILLQNLYIYVPSNSVETYKTANKWSSWASKIFAIQD